MDVSEKNM